VAEKQSRADRFMEALTNIAIGLTISTAANQVFIPLATGHPLTLRSNVALGVIYTIISLVRSYLIRRAFNGQSVWMAIKGRAANAL
jgi:hypothetical protein